MIEVAATHKYSNVRTSLFVEDFDEFKKLNSKYWSDFEIIGPANQKI